MPGQTKAACFARWQGHGESMCAPAAAAAAAAAAGGGGGGGGARAKKKSPSSSSAATNEAALEALAKERLGGRGTYKRTRQLQERLAALDDGHVDDIFTREAGAGEAPSDPLLNISIDSHVSLGSSESDSDEVEAAARAAGGGDGGGGGKGHRFDDGDEEEEEDEPRAPELMSRQNREAYVHRATRVLARGRRPPGARGGHAAPRRKRNHHNVIEGELRMGATTLMASMSPGTGRIRMHATRDEDAGILDRSDVEDDDDSDEG